MHRIAYVRESPPSREAMARRLAFGRAVRASRTAAGLSQERLAELAGCDRKSVNRLETAAYAPSLDRIFDISHSLGISPASLFVAASASLTSSPLATKSTVQPAPNDNGIPVLRKMGASRSPRIRLSTTHLVRRASVTADDDHWTMNPAADRAVSAQLRETAVRPETQAHRTISS
jgi:transcriptional regulator with XRE-family HTH domain